MVAAVQGLERDQSRVVLWDMDIERGGLMAAPLADSAEGVAYFFGLHFWTDWEPLVEPSANRVTAELTHFLWHRAMT